MDEGPKSEEKQVQEKEKMSRVEWRKGEKRKRVGMGGVICQGCGGSGVGCVQERQAFSAPLQMSKSAVLLQRGGGTAHLSRPAVYLLKRGEYAAGRPAPGNQF